MIIQHIDELPRDHPPESTFTGDVRIGGYFQRPAPSTLAGATVRLGPRARTPWKTNPVGQSIVVIAGVGRAQVDGGDVQEIRAGDIVWFAPDELHWEGAAPDQPVTYVAIQEEPAGRSVHFHEAVTDRQYGVE